MTAGTKGSWSGGGESDGELLVETADRLRWRAPELALVFARHAATRADASHDRGLALRANALVVAALVRLGKHAEAVEPAVLTLREAESTGARELAGSVRVDLAASTRAVGLAGSAFVLVRPMLEGSDTRPSVRAGALAEIVAGLAQAGRREVIDEVLSEADRLYAADEALGSDVRRVLRALLCARIASFRRRWGNPTGAVAAATEGMTLLDGLIDPATDSGQARAELGLEMVSALLDAGEDDAALGQADQTLNHPIRATSAAAVGRLMLILSTRVHLPAGRVKEAHAMLAEIVRVARRHDLDGLLADVLTSLAHAQETDGDLTDALNSLRSARAAEQRRLRADTMARLIVLEELGAGTRLPDDTEALLRRVVRTPARSISDASSREVTSREIASREMSGRELGGADIGSQDILGRELAGWEMVARERAARDSTSSRAVSDLIEADRAAADWPPPDYPGSGWPAYDQISSDWEGSQESGSEQTSVDWTAGTSVSAAASAGGGRRRAPVEWSAADRVAADRAVSELASADVDESLMAADGARPKWPDQGVAEERDEETGLLNRQGLRRRLAAARRQSRPTALTLVRLEPSEIESEPQTHNPDPDSTDRFSAALIMAIDRAGRMPPDYDPDVLNALADHVRDMAPEDAELARPDEGELAVLLPDTTRDEAERFAATLRETVSRSDWDPQDPARSVSLSTGVAQYQEGTSEDALLTAAREALTSTESERYDDQPNWQSVEPVYDLPPEDSGHTFMPDYAQLSHDGPEPPDQEMAEYLAGFPLPEYGQWSHTEEPDMPPHHDAASTRHDAATSTDDEAGRAVLDRLEITRGSGGRRRAPDSFGAEQSADYAQYPPDQSADNYPRYPDDAPYDGTGDEILAAAEQAALRASIPSVPDPEEIPTPPDSPEIPPIPNPDADPAPGRRRYPGDPEPAPEPHPGHRGLPTHPDIDPQPDRRGFPGDPDSDPRPGRFPGDPDPDRRGLPTHPDIDPEPGRRGLPTHPDIDPQPDRRGFPADPGSDPRPDRFPGDHDPDRHGFPADPDADPQPDRFAADPDRDPGQDRRGFPTHPDIGSELGYRDFPTHPDVDPEPDRRGFPADFGASRGPDGFPGDLDAEVDPKRNRGGFPAGSGFAGEPDRTGAPVVGPEAVTKPVRRRFPADLDLAGLADALERTADARGAQMRARRNARAGSGIDAESSRGGFPAADSAPDSGTTAGRSESPAGLAGKRAADDLGFPADDPDGGRRQSPPGEGAESPLGGLGVARGLGDDVRPGRRRAREAQDREVRDSEPRQQEPGPRSGNFPHSPDFSQPLSADDRRPGRRRMPDPPDLPNGQSTAAARPQSGGLGIPDEIEARPGRRRAPEPGQDTAAGRPSPRPKPRPEPQSEARPRPELQPEPSPRPESKPVPRLQPDPRPEPRVQPDPKPEPRVQPTPEPRLRVTPQPRPNPQPVPPLQQKPQPEPAPESGPESRRDQQLAAQPEPVSAREPESRWESRRDQQSAGQADLRSGRELESRQGQQPVAEPEPRQDQQQAEQARPGSRTGDGQDPQEPRRRRWASILDGEERSGLPPEPAEPLDPRLRSESPADGADTRPSRIRRREKTDVKLADLLAEALVAYQASTAEHPDEDVLSAYDDAAGRVVEDTPRRERETGY